MTFGLEGELYVSNVGFGPPPVGLGRNRDLTIADSGDTYNGSFSYKVYDLSGNLIFTAEGNIMAQRITAD